MRCLMTILLGVGSAVAAPVPKELKKTDDRQLLLGTWALVKANVDGKEDPNYFWHSVTFSADGGSCFRYKGLPDEPYNEFVVNTTDTPRTVTWRKNAVNSFNPRPYAFRDGRLVMSTGVGNKQGPASLEPGPGVIVFEYERTEKK